MAERRSRMSELARQDRYTPQPLSDYDQAIVAAQNVGRMANPERFRDAWQSFPLSANVQYDPLSPPTFDERFRGF